MESFSEFVTARSHRLLHLAYLLTRDHALAEDLLQTALARSWTVWGRIVGDPEPYVRRVLINTHHSWWRRRWKGEHPFAELPEQAEGEPQSEVDNRDEVWRALARLPKRQQAVMVLRYFEDLSEVQIAQTLSITASAVRSYEAKALAKLRIDPTLGGVPSPSPLEVPQGAQRLAAVERLVVTRRRRQMAVATAAGAFLGALIAALLLFKPVRQLPPADPQPSFPSTYEGYRTVLLEQQRFSQVSQRTFALTPTTPVVRIWLACTYVEPGLMPPLHLTASAGGPDRDITQQCDDSGQLTFGEGHLLTGLVPGAPVTFSFSFESDSIAPVGWVSVAIGEPDAAMGVLEPSGTPGPYPCQSLPPSPTGTGGICDRTGRPSA